jgi:hypothetical protein
MRCKVFFIGLPLFPKIYAGFEAAACLKGSFMAYINTPGKKRIGFYFTTTPPLRMATHFRKSRCLISAVVTTSAALLAYEKPILTEKLTAEGVTMANP